MNELIEDPIVVAVLLGIAVSVFSTFTRFTKGSLVLVTLVLLASIEVAIFDGRRHPTEKFDATILAWGHAVELRAVAGGGVVLLAGPIGRIVSKLIARKHGALLGLLSLGPFGLGLLASSAQLLTAMRTILSESPSPEARNEPLRTAVSQSTWWVSGGTVASVAACVAIAVFVASATGPSPRETGVGRE
jgi:hypothetical protein